MSKVPEEPHHHGEEFNVPTLFSIPILRQKICHISGNSCHIIPWMWRYKQSCQGRTMIMDDRWFYMESRCLLDKGGKKSHSLIVSCLVFKSFPLYICSASKERNCFLHIFHKFATIILIHIDRLFSPRRKKTFTNFLLFFYRNIKKLFYHKWNSFHFHPLQTEKKHNQQFQHASYLLPTSDGNMLSQGYFWFFLSFLLLARSCIRKKSRLNSGD